MSEMILDATAVQTRAADPVISPAYTLPTDYVAQYPIPLDTQEIVAMCEEITVLKYLTPTQQETSLKAETWQELNSLAFTSGSSYINFADGTCPEEYSHDGSPTTVTLKNIGAKKSLGLSDIKQSAAIAAANWNGINRLNGPQSWGIGQPGGNDAATFQNELVADLKAKEIRLGATLVMNGWDNLLVNGDSGANALAFDGFTTIVTGANGAHTNDNSASGSFSAAGFNRWIEEGCAMPDVIVGTPQATQEMLSSYFQLGFAGSQVVESAKAERIVPGYNFASWVNTSRGRVQVVSDRNFARTNIAGGNFQSKLYALKMVHNGVPLVYMSTQFPLAMYDLVGGCTAISFMLWAKTALIVKHKCAHGVYTSQFTGRIVTTCPVIL